MTKRWLVAGAALALAGIALLCTPSDGFAQRGWRGGRGGWDGGGRGWEGNGGWNGGWGYGGRGWDGGWGYGGRGWGGYGVGFGNRGWGWGYPSYGYGSGYSMPYYSSDTYGYDYGYPYGGTDYYGSGTTDSDTSGYAGADMQGSQNSVMLDVNVPGNAEVFVEGQKTTQTGNRRMFVSPPLTPGRTYTYDVRARWMQNGREVDQTRHVSVQPGQRTRVDFMRGERGGATMEEYPGPNYGREPGDRRMEDRNLRPEDRTIRPEDRNIRPEDRNVRPEDRNVRPEDRNVRPEDRNVKPEDRNVRPEDRNAPSSAPAPRDTTPSKPPKDNPPKDNPPKDNPPKDNTNPPPKPPDR